MLKFVMLGFIIAALVVFIIWKPWKDLLALRRWTFNFWDNPKIMIFNIIKLLIIPVLIVLVVTLYFVFGGDHEHVYVETARTEPTCTEAGRIVRTCSECGMTSTKVLKATHKWRWGGWCITKYPSIVSLGERERTCLIAGCAAEETGRFLGSGSICVLIVLIVIIILTGVGLYFSYKNKNWTLRWVLCILGASGIIAMIIYIFILIFGWFSAKDTPKTASENGQKESGQQEPGQQESGQQESHAVSIKIGNIFYGVKIKEASASSHLEEPGYELETIIEKSFDGNVDTCWQDGNHEEGDPGVGIGQVLEYKFEKPCYIVRVSIINGRVKDEKNYYENCRIRSMTVKYFLDGKEMALVSLKDLKDVYSRRAEDYDLVPYASNDPKYYCDEIKIVIDDVYEGTKHRDLCLTEIAFYEKRFDKEKF